MDARQVEALVRVRTQAIAEIAAPHKAVYGILFNATADTLRTIAPIRAISGPRSVSSPCCTPGDRP